MSRPLLVALDGAHWTQSNQEGLVAWWEKKNHVKEGMRVRGVNGSSPAESETMNLAPDSQHRPHVKMTGWADIVQPRLADVDVTV